MGMFWWIPAVVPLLACAIILLSPLWPIASWQGEKSSRHIEHNLKRFGAYFGLNLFACMIIAVLMWAGTAEKSKFQEVWNFKVVGIKHEMEWTEREQRSRQVPCGTETYYTGTGRDRQSHTRTKYRTEYYYVTEHYGPYWKARDEYNKEFHISQSAYNYWKNVWKNEKQTGMHKGSSAGWERKIDGPIFACSWPNTFETIYPDVSIHSYVNKIRVSNSVLRFGTPTKEQLAMYPRPVDIGNTSPFVSYDGVYRISGDDLLFLSRVNALLGFKKEIHTILVLFGKDKDRGVVDDVLTAWGGPNKNELVTFMSLDGNKIRWVEVHSWMDNTTLHARLRDELAGTNFTVRRYGELIMQYAPTLWWRKDFTPINEYLKVDVSPWWMFSGIMLSIAFCVGAFFIIDRNMVIDDWYHSRGF
jgi:hypothetical protein